MRIQRNIIILFHFFILINLLGCKPYFNAHNYHFGHNQKRAHITECDDLLKDSLILKDFVLMYLHIDEKESKINLQSNIYDYFIIDDKYSDSIFNVFYSSLSQFELPIKKYSGGRNKLTSSFMENVSLKFKRIKHEHLFQIAEEYPNQNVLIPIIRVKNDASSISLPPSSSAILSLFIIRNQTILFYKSMKVKNGDPINNKTFINQDRWEGLVHVTIWDYIEHIGLGKKYNNKTWK